MSQVVRVRLSQENASILQTMQEQEPAALEELVNRALSDYLFSLRFEQLRARMSQVKEGRPTYSEDEILELVS